MLVTASNGKRADLATNSGTVIIHSNCPLDLGGSATSELDLEIHIESRLGVISGPSQSFLLGSCVPSDEVEGGSQHPSLPSSSALEALDKKLENHGRRREAKDQDTLYNTISAKGKMKASSGVVLVSSGTFRCGSCDSEESMYRLDAISGFIRCDSDKLSCIQDGEGKRGVMTVVSQQPLGIRGIVFLRGKGTQGGGLYCDGGATITLEVCSFTECKATGQGGGGGLYINDGSAHFYAVSFANNEASEEKRSDFAVNGGSVTVHSDLPSDVKGAVVSQSDLEASVLSIQGWISGPLKSFALPGAIQPQVIVPAPAPLPAANYPVKIPTPNPNPAITPSTPVTPSPTLGAGALSVNVDVVNVDANALDGFPPFGTYMLFVAFCLFV